MLNTKDYKTEIHRQLVDDRFDKILPEDPTPKFKTQIHDQLMHCMEVKMNSATCLLNNPYFLCTTKNPQEPHKPTWPTQDREPHGKKKKSSFVDSFWKPYVWPLPSFTRDSMDIIKLLGSLPR